MSEERQYVSREQFEQLRREISEAEERREERLDERGRTQNEANLEILCNREMVRMCEDGEIDRFAKKHGLSYVDAWTEKAKEAYEPLVEMREVSRALDQKHASRVRERELGLENLEEEEG